MTTLDQAREDLRLRQGKGARHDAADAPAQALAHVRLGTAYFARKLLELSDSALDEPSADPGRTRARIVAEVALQARAIAWQIDGGEGAQDSGAAAYLADVETCATLPPRALRYLFEHTAIHLNVVWRDLPGTDWDAERRAQVASRARTIWLSALELGNGAHPRDLPFEYRPQNPGQPNKQ